MKVSIIIPIYNAEKYIIRCLNSIISQTYKNIECILVDDCSKDKCMIIIKQFIKDYNGPVNFIIKHHATNRGPSAARNTGIRSASGSFIYFLDSDDAIVPETIEILLSLFEKYPNCELAQGNILDQRGQISLYGFKSSFPEYTIDKNEIYNIILSKTTTTAWNRLIKKDFIFQHNLFFPEGIINEDMLWCYFVAKHARAISIINKGLYIYYVNEESIMTSHKRDSRIKWYKSRLWSSEEYIKDMKKGHTNKYQRQYLAINLLSCLVELNKIHSIKHWFTFWCKICTLTFSIINKISWHRFMFFLCLIPPACFISSNEKIRWRIQKNIISYI